MSEPGDALARVHKKVRETLANKGFRLVGLGFVPGLADGDRLRLEMGIVSDPDWQPKGEDDAAFEAVIDQAREAEAALAREKRAEESRKALEGLGNALKDPKGGIGL